jgi:predicted nucleotidyltransferase
MIVPEMGTAPEHFRGSLASALFSPVQGRVLALLFGQPDRRFRTAEIIELVGSGTGAVHRQLQRMAGVGLLTAVSEGNQRLYQANRNSPVFDELRGLVLKTVGLAEPLREALAPLESEIEAAFIYGSVAKGTDRTTSDVDLLVISDAVDYSRLYEALQKAEALLAREIKPTLLKRAEWKRKGARDGFVKRISDQPKLFLIGDESALP